VEGDWQRPRISHGGSSWLECLRTHGLGVKLYCIIEDLRSAPEEPALFRAKLMSFKNGLDHMQKVIDRGVDEGPLVAHATQLRTVLQNSQGCVQRCEKFMEGVRQAVHWVWKKDTVAKLTAEIDSPLHAMTLAIQLINL